MHKVLPSAALQLVLLMAAVFVISRGATPVRPTSLRLKLASNVANCQLVWLFLTGKSTTRFKIQSEIETKPWTKRQECSVEQDDRLTDRSSGAAQDRLASWLAGQLATADSFASLLAQAAHQLASASRRQASSREQAQASRRDAGGMLSGVVRCH